MNLRRASGLALLGVLGLLLAACSWSGSHEPSDFSGSGENLGDVRQAVLDAGSAEVRFTVTALGNTTEVQGPIAFTGDLAELEAALTFQAAGEEATEFSRIVDGIQYIPAGEANDQWLSVPVDAGEFFEQLDPLAVLDLLSATVESMEADGDAVELDGVDAQEYALELSTQRWAEILGTPAAAGDFSGTMAARLWIGKDDLPRRLTMSVEGQIDLTWTFSNWGVDFTVEAPPAEQVSELQLN